MHRKEELFISKVISHLGSMSPNEIGVFYYNNIHFMKRYEILVVDDTLKNISRKY